VHAPLLVYLKVRALDYVLASTRNS